MRVCEFEEGMQERESRILQLENETAIANQNLQYVSAHNNDFFFLSERLLLIST